MYHVISTGLTVAILYLISFIFYTIGFYSRLHHRKLWNIILAVSFIFTAFAGLFLALQINYKWNIPFIKTILKWHVECGAGLAFTGLIHFFAHLPYFGKIFKTEESVIPEPFTFAWSYRTSVINLFLIGFVSTSVQLLLMREMINIAGGYELIAGTFLGSWLICSAAGAIIARHSGIIDIRRINLVFGFSPILSILLMIVLNRFFLSPGETPSFFVSIIYTLIVLIPFCFVSGFAFIRILMYSRKFSIKSGRSFSIETVGGIVAGLAVTFLTSGIINTYRLLFLIITGFLSYAIISCFTAVRWKIIAFITTAVIVILIFSFNPDIYFRHQLLHTIKITSSGDTPYGNISTGIYGGEENIYYNQRLLTWKNDETEREENIHYAMLQSSNPAKVLLISGDIRSNLPEVLKYPVKEVYFVERDPALLKMVNILPDYQSDILKVRNIDGFRFVKKTDEVFDVVILILPPPSTLLLNRYYTTDFFREVKKRLSKNGVFACSPGSGENYFNKESTVLYSSVYNSLSAVFTNVMPIVGHKLYLISSDGPLSAEICSLVEQRKISNVYVSPDFLSDDLLKMKSQELLLTIDKKVKMNTAEMPLATFHFQSYNLSKNLKERIPALILLLIVFLFPVAFVRAGNMIMYTSASALAAFEIIMLVALQSSVGNMYQLTGLIIAALMTGLATGASANIRSLIFKSPLTISLLLILFYFSSALVINKITEFESSVLNISIILVLSIIPSFFTGMIFSKLTEKSAHDSDTSSVYGADLAGSALGFIVVSGIVIPALGIQITLFLLSLWILTGLLFGTIRNKS